MKPNSHRLMLGFTKNVLPNLSGLIALGKTLLQAVCAVMRKLLHAIHGMLAHDQAFDN